MHETSHCVLEIIRSGTATRVFDSEVVFSEVSDLGVF